MGKHSDINIDEMLKQIQENIEKQSFSDVDEKQSSDNTENNAAPKSQEELLKMIMADIGEEGVKPVKSSDADKYDISGFEIEESDDLVEDESSADEIDEFTEDEVFEIEVVDETNVEEAEKLESPEDLVSNSEETFEAEKSEAEQISDEASELLEELPDILVRENFSDLQSESEVEERNDGALVEDINEAENDDNAIEEIDETQLILSEPSSTFEELSSEPEAEPEEETVVAETSAPVENESNDPGEEKESIDSVEKEKKERLEALLGDIIDQEEQISSGLSNVTSTFFVKTENECSEVDDEEIADSSREEQRNLDEADINLSLALGNKDSLEHAIGFIKVREAQHNFVNPTQKDAVGNVILDYRTTEYKSHVENGEIKDKYRKEKKRIGLRLAFTAVALALLLFCELVYSFDSIYIPYVSEFLAVPLYYGLVSIGISLGAVALSPKKLFVGLIGFFTSRSNYYSTVSFMLLVNLLYSVIVLTLFGDGIVLLLNSVTIFGLLIVIIGEFLRISREMLTFKLISDERPKIVLERVDVSPDIVKKESFLRGNDFVIERANFFGKYFERSAKTPQSYQIRYTFTMLTMLVALLVAVIAVIVTKDFAYFVLAFELSVLLGIPEQFAFLGPLPYYIVSKKLYKKDSAVIGETIDDEYVGSNTVYLDDVEMFGKHGVKVINLEPHNGFNIVDVYYYYLSIFEKINTPLKNAFGDISDKMRLSDNVLLKTVYKNGIEAVVDGKNVIYIGKMDFMMEKGVSLGKCVEEKGAEKDDISFMYVSINNALCAKMTLKYSITSHFESFAEEMSESNVKVGIRTVDPNITEKMLGRLQKTLGEIKVIRPSFNDLVPIERRSNSGVITVNNPHMIAQILAEGLKIKKMNWLINLIWGIYSFMGMGAVIAFSIFGIFDKILPVYIIGYQMAWLIGMGIYTIEKFRNRKVK